MPSTQLLFWDVTEASWAHLFVETKGGAQQQQQQQLEV